MIVETRKTAQGTEYWNNVEKKILFVPAGEKPHFDVRENPESMLIGVDLASGPDRTGVNKEVVEGDIDLDAMDADQLLQFAKQNHIDVPRNMKKPETIRKHIEESLTATDAE